ncbi:MAG: YdcF family protein [Anaerolineales bacterium]
MDVMLELLVEAVKRYLLPGSLPLLLFATTLALGWMYLDQRRREWPQALLTGLVVIYWLLSLPVVSNSLTAGLSAGTEPVESSIDVDAVVVLGGGASVPRVDGLEMTILSEGSARRALEGARLYHFLDTQWVIVSGGTGRDPEVPESEPLRSALIEQGVPADRILTESGSSDTHDQAVLLFDLLDEREVEKFVLVTSPAHMRRSLGAFRAVGLDPLPSPAQPAPEDASQSEEILWLPSIEALGESMTAAREYMAIGYYWLRGWY